MSLSLRILALSAFASVGAAQQFVLQSGAIPGTPTWTEGVEAADVDNDGDLDLFFADGEGFTTPGAKRQNVLIINRLETMAGSFVDESVARLGVHLSNAKMAITGDIQGDGFIDAMFCNAFATDLPFLYVNQGSSSPGFFTFEGVARGFTAAYSSGSGQFGDLDNDGDLDVILNDAYLGSPTGKPHFFRNDGTGVFSEDSAFTAAAATKSAQMDVQLADLDGDLDLDFLGICRAENGTSGAGDHYLMINDGSGAFSDESESLPDGNSSGVYEGELGDLDGDTDLDLFIVSISGFSDGPLQNGVIPSGTLSFTAGPSIGGDDDNEVAMFDYDNDGDYDPFVGSLGFSGEKVFINNLGFTQSGTVIESVSDSTLDMTIADLDNDGAYDLITAQGESNSAQWSNKWYRNTGSADSLPPVVIAEESLPVTGVGGAWVVRASVQDQVMDDGKNWVAGAVNYVLLDSPLEAGLDAEAGGFSMATLDVSAGTTVTWTNQDASSHSIVSATDGYTFDSGPLAMGEAFSYTFITGGTYDYTDGVGGLAAAQIVVTDSPLAGIAGHSGGSIYRFEMTDTGGGSSIALAYELRFTDWAGNLTATESKRIDLGHVFTRPGTPNPQSYACEAPVLGATINATVDLDGTTGHTFALIFGFDSEFTFTLGGGQVLLALDVGGSGELLQLGSQGGPLAAFAIPIPADLSLLGFGAFTQAVHFGGVVPFALSNSQDLFLGL